MQLRHENSQMFGVAAAQLTVHRARQDVAVQAAPHEVCPRTATRLLDCDPRLPTSTLLPPRNAQVREERLQILRLQCPVALFAASADRIRCQLVVAFLRAV